MNTAASPLLQRLRKPTEQELLGISWWHALRPEHRSYAQEHLLVGSAFTGELVCRIGSAPTYWMGLLSGLLKMTNDTTQHSRTIIFAGLAPGGWFGEGTLLKREPYRYNLRVLRDSLIAVLPVDAFHWLLEHSIEFNRVLMRQLNERVGQFIAARELERMTNQDIRVARTLAALFNPVLFPSGNNTLHSNQQELAQLVKLSRKRVNEALRVLESHGAIRVVYGGLVVQDLDMLRNGDFVRADKA